MKRRSFIGALAAVPVVGVISPSELLSQMAPAASELLPATRTGAISVSQWMT